MKMSLVYGTCSILLVNYVFAASVSQASIGSDRATVSATNISSSSTYSTFQTRGTTLVNNYPRWTSISSSSTYSTPRTRGTTLVNNYPRWTSISPSSTYSTSRTRGSTLLNSQSTLLNSQSKWTSISQSSTTRSTIPTKAYRTINLATSSIHDYYMSFSRFKMCLPNVVGMSFTFRVKSCHDARIALLTEHGLYEIVIGDRYNRSYIQHISTDGNYILLGEADGMFLDCNAYRQFTISWGGDNISLIARHGHMTVKGLNHITLKYATVATGFGAAGKWAINTYEVLPVQTVKAKYNNKHLLLCPSVNECSDDLPYDGFELENGIGPWCEDKNKSGSIIYVKFNYSALCGPACTTEFIQLTVCSSTETEMCNTCTITNYAFDYSLLHRYHNSNQNKIDVFDVNTTCELFKDSGIYFRFVHFMSEDYGYRTINVTQSKIHVTPLPIHDYNMSLLQFRICLNSVETMYLTFNVKSCRDARLVLLGEKGFGGLIYEIVFGEHNLYIHEKGPGGYSTRKNRTNGVSSDCNRFRQFWISWDTNHITIGEASENILISLSYSIRLLHAAVMSGLIPNDAEWLFYFPDTGMLQPVDFKNETNRLCPLLSNCDLKMEQHSCNPILSGIKIDCKKDGQIYLSRKCNNIGNADQACTTEFIQMTSCVSTTKSGCKTCQISKDTYYAASLCNGNHMENPYKLMSVRSCEFFKMHGLESYFRYVHFKSRHEVVTTTESPPTTKDAEETTSRMTPTTIATLTSPTSTASPTTSPMKFTTINTFDESPQKSNAPLTIGIVVGATGLLLAVICAVVLLIFIRRSKKKEQQQSSTMINTKGDDYTGNQSVAMPTGSNNPKSGKYTDIQLEIEEQHYQELTEISKTENEVSYDYINPSDVKRKSETGTETENQKHEYIKQVDNVLDFPPKTDGTVYSVLDPNETGFNRSPDLSMIATDTEPSSSYAVLDPTVTGFDRSQTPTITSAEPYAILDPSATGFNRLENANQSGYEMAKPLNDDHKIGEISEQPYSSDYNELGDSVVQNVDKNVYSHSVDSVYDSANHNIKSKESDGNYDHFVGK